MKMELKNEFFMIKIKKQNYLGKPAIAMYMGDVTKKLKEKLAKLERREELQE